MVLCLAVPKAPTMKNPRNAHQRPLGLAWVRAEPDFLRMRSQKEDIKAAKENCRERSVGARCRNCRKPHCQGLPNVAVHKDFEGCTDFGIR